MQNKGPGVRRREPGERGFTLIETVITLVVLSIAAVGVLSVFTVGIRGSANPLIVDQATQLAQGEMEQVFGEKIANGFAGVGLSCKTNMLTGFACARTVNLVDANTKQVTVTISQPTLGSISLDTRVTNY